MIKGTDQRVVLASSNAGKLRELGSMLTKLSIELVAQQQLGIDDAIEDGLSFVENAIIKARHASLQADLPAIADDSGLEVPALDGAPGIYSARYAGEHARDADNNAKLLHDMQHLDGAERNANFRCAIIWLRHPKDPVPLIAQGCWQGRILAAPQGSHGFG
ncbi:MAG: non-canonical purine NTP pyrophosphatase, partial [Pseudomonadales bacterium]